jgi:hypothetical protein
MLAAVAAAKKAFVAEVQVVQVEALEAMLLKLVAQVYKVRATMEELVLGQVMAAVAACLGICWTPSCKIAGAL